MESPVFIVMLALWACSGVGVALPQFLFLLLFLLHYFQRSFVFPFLMKGKSKMPVAIMAMGIVFKMPVAIMAMGIVFNVLNGMMQAGGLFYFNGNVPTGIGWSYLSEPHALIGLLLFFIGMGINLHSDHVIRTLRKPGDTSLSSAEGDVPLCYFCQLFRGTGGMDGICRTHGFACRMGVCVVDGCQFGSTCQCHLSSVL